MRCVARKPDFIFSVVLFTPLLQLPGDPYARPRPRPRTEVRAYINRKAQRAFADVFRINKRGPADPRFYHIHVLFSFIILTFLSVWPFRMKAGIGVVESACIAEKPVVELNHQLYQIIL